MKLYTLISIALSIFGGTYAAMAALRTRFERLISKTEEEGAIHLKKIIEHYGQKTSTAGSADSHLRWICKSSKLWNRCNTIPTLLFSVLVFIVAIWVLIEWSFLCTDAGDDLSKCPITQSCFFLGLLILVLVDGFCFVGAAAAWLICKSHGKTLYQQYNTALEDEKNKITPA
jgi:hypothetical protein